jgi:glutamate/tyrosine decarboxylase-like PLP-dependent enzyme
MRIPETGAAKEQVLEQLEALRSGDIAWKEGKTFAHVFLASEEAKETAERAYLMYLWENGLDPTLFPSLLRLENEIVAMARDHLRGDSDVVGSFTSGGTESVLLAVKTARDRARALRPDLEHPEMVLPVTAHPCFHKAAHYFGVKTLIVPVDPRTFKADVEAMRDAITPRTILLVGSAPSYAHGVVDPIPDIGRLALAHDLLLHVDGCIGAFLLPFFRELGAGVTDFDFSVPGVTSISMDFHKYAFAAKGASVVLYRNAGIRRYQFFSWSGWPGYTLVNPTIQSSRSGGPLAATWSVLRCMGHDGYLREARRLKEATDAIVSGVGSIEGLEVLGSPEMCLVAVAANGFSIFQLCDAMKERGWHVYPQLRLGELRENFHLTVLPWNVERIDLFLGDLDACVQEIRARADGGGAPGLKEALGEIDLAALSVDELGSLLEAAGLVDAPPGGGMADVNEILNGLPPDARDRLLTVYLDQMSRYREAPA